MSLGSEFSRLGAPSVTTENVGRDASDANWITYLEFAGRPDVQVRLYENGDGGLVVEAVTRDEVYPIDLAIPPTAAAVSQEPR